MDTDLASVFPLRPGRVHEVCGAGAMAFCAVTAAHSRTNTLWVRETWLAEMLNPLGFVPFLDPARLLLARSPGQTDSLAVAEEALRDGAVALVVIETTRPLDLREGRRLQLAAKDGGSTGLCLIPEGMGSNATETRWRCSPVFDPDGGSDDSTLRWDLIKNKSGTLGAWNVRWDTASRRITVVSPVGQRPGSAGTSG